jgi:hypothetical protein
MRSSVWQGCRRRIYIFIYLFIYLFVMTACSPEAMALRKTDKMLERERANNPEVMPSSPMNKCKMQK